LPQVSVHKGNFLISTKWAALASPMDGLLHPCLITVCVLKTEEKGADVNLACHLIADGYKDAYDVAVVVSNDTDLVEPLRIVVQDLKKPVGLICPTDKAARSLKRRASSDTSLLRDLLPPSFLTRFRAPVFANPRSGKRPNVTTCVTARTPVM
jgi:uncharacterized LabA/DUF88 family protein